MLHSLIVVEPKHVTLKPVISAIHLRTRIVAVARLGFLRQIRNGCLIEQFRHHPQILPFVRLLQHRKLLCAHHCRHSVQRDDLRLGFRFGQQAVAPRTFADSIVVPRQIGSGASSRKHEKRNNGQRNLERLLSGNNHLCTFIILANRHAF